MSNQDYERLAFEDLAFRELSFSRDQMVLVGKVLSLKDDPRVKSTEVAYWGDKNLNTPRRVGGGMYYAAGLRVKLADEVIKQGSDHARETTKVLLEGKGIDTTNLVQFCAFSYGIEAQEPNRVDIHFGY